MANTKISALTSATTPLAGTETLPVVQSSATTKVAVSDLTAGRSVSGANFVVTSSTVPANGLYLPAANSVGIATNSTLRATFDASGNVGIGITPASPAKLEIKQSAATQQGTWVYASANDSHARLFCDGTSVGLAASFTSTGSYLPMKFYTSGLERISISAAGDATILTGNVVIGTSGKGIDFSAVTHAGSTSKLLADYEEGTFTPTLTRSGTAPTVVYSTQKGFYTKIGNAVTCTVFLQWTANAGGTGYWYAASLPFTSKNSASCIASSAIGDYTGFTLAVGTTQLGLEVNPNVTYGVFQCSGSAVSSNVINTVAATGFVILTVTYFTA